MALYLSEFMMAVLGKASFRDTLLYNLHCRQNYSTDIDFNNLDFVVKDEKIFISYLTNSRNNGIANVWSSPLRQEARVGKILKKLYPNSSDSEIEKATEVLKTVLISNEYKFKFLNGQALIDAYSKNCYHPDATDGTSLGGSCMRNPDKGHYMKLYADNPDSVRLLTSWVGEWLVARALFWNGTYKGKQVNVLDRIYFRNKNDKFFLENHVKADTQLIHIMPTRILIEVDTGKPLHEDVIVKLDNTDMDRYPYLDCFKFLDAKNKTLHYFDIPGKSYQLQQQDGGATSTAVYWSEPIPTGYQYSQVMNTILPVSDILPLNGRWYPKTHVFVCELCEQVKLNSDKLVGSPHNVCTREVKRDKKIGKDGYTLNGIFYHYCEKCATRIKTLDDRACTKCLEKLKTCLTCDVEYFATSSYTKQHCANCQERKCLLCKKDYTRKTSASSAYCGPCLSENADCSNCGKFVTKDDIHKARGSNWCSSCYERYLVQCTACDRHEWKSDAFYKSFDAVECRNCYAGASTTYTSGTAW